MRIFVDSCIFLDCLEDERSYRTLRRVKNDNHQIITSITVVGETVEVCFRKSKDLAKIVELWRELDVEFIYPVSQVRFCCLCLDDLLREEKVYGSSVTDRTHLAYAIAHELDFFVTSRSELRSLKKPSDCLLKTKIVDIEGLREELGY